MYVGDHGVIAGGASQMLAASQRAGVYRGQLTVIVDMKHLGIRHLTPSVISVLQKRTKLEESHYPEVCRRCDSGGHQVMCVYLEAVMAACEWRVFLVLEGASVCACCLIELHVSAGCCHTRVSVVCICRAGSSSSMHQRSSPPSSTCFGPSLRKRRGTRHATEYHCTHLSALTACDMTDVGLPSSL